MPHTSDILETLFWAHFTTPKPHVVAPCTAVSSSALLWCLLSLSSPSFSYPINNPFLNTQPQLPRLPCTPCTHPAPPFHVAAPTPLVILACRLNWSEVKPRTQCRLEPSYIPVAKTPHRPSSSDKAADRDAASPKSPSTKKVHSRLVHSSLPVLLKCSLPMHRC